MGFARLDMDDQEGRVRYDFVDSFATVEVLY
jgi:hypothetical protein